MESTEGANEPRVKRQKVNHKSAVFERLKQLKGKGSKNKYEVSNIDNVYEVVDEKEYSKKVWERQDDDWIVDDDGSGYVEDGRDIFDDDLDSESIAHASKTSDTRKKKKNVSRLAAKGNIQSLLSNMPDKKKETVNLDQDDILSDVLSGMDENVASTTKKSNISFINEAEEAKDYMKSLSAPKPMKVKLKSGLIKAERQKKSVILKEIPISKNVLEKILIEKSPENNYIPEDDNVIDDSMFDDDFPITDPVNVKVNESVADDNNDLSFDDDFNIDGLDEICEEKKIKLETSEIENEITEKNLSSGWQIMQNGVKNEAEVDVVIDFSNLPITENSEGEQVFRFYWWDAYEDILKQPGTVFLFGKTYIESAKSYVSCCVVVRNIERKMFLLPRPFQMNEHKTVETNVPVKLVDVYHEFNEISDKMNITSFRSRKVTKKYAFNPEIPSESDYLEIRYSAKFPALYKNESGKTFSHVFGTDTSFLEILLLDKKIKGPCWLEIKNPKPVTNPLSWCKLEVNCTSTNDIFLSNKIESPPPLVVATINIRTAISKQMTNEIIMIGCLVHNKYFIDKQPPNPNFQQHFCVFTQPAQTILPTDFHDVLKNYKATHVQKCDFERALLNCFLNKFSKIDPDLVVGHDLIDFHLNTLCNRLEATKATLWSRFGRLKRTIIPTKTRSQKDLMIGRLVCDLKISARELIKSRSYDLQTLCQTVLKLKDNVTYVLESGDVLKYFGTSEHVLELISCTMQEAGYITKMLYELNIMPLALQITSIAGNIMSKTLQGGRAQRNEFLLLHAFTERNYICPDKTYGKKEKTEQETENTTKSSRKKPTYSGGLVLDPKIGFYDKLILLMDFNSLYPSIIQEYNICFTTMPINLDTETMLSSTISSEPGILPTEIRKLVESRRQVKQLMANSDITNDLRMQYNIRQLALKLTANSMYGCLGFQNSRFFAKHLASFVTMKGRDILLHTRDLVQGMGYEVVYGDTDSIMINTNILDYDQVFKIGNNIKQAVNKSYRQVELEVDGVFKYMLLLKKKKYAAVTITKNKSGEIILQQEHKGLDIVRRDWSMLAAEVGKMILNHILSDQSTDERLENIQNVLSKVAEDLREGRVPLSLLVITKQLTKDPKLYTDKAVLSHVQVALRYNQKGGKPLKAGDTVPYVICEDGTNASSTQRAYHVEELKKLDKLKIDITYYLAQQIHPVVSRLCEPIEGLDGFQIANSLGIDSSTFKVSKPKPTEANETYAIAPVKKFKNAEPFEFTCLGCKQINSIKTLMPENGKYSRFWLEKCSNENCHVKPINYLYALQNKLFTSIKTYVEEYYGKILICEDPICVNETNVVPLKFVGKYPVCNLCNAGVMYKKYSETDLYEQISFFNYICDLSKLEKKPTDERITEGYKQLKETIDYFLTKSGYSIINLTLLYANLTVEENTLKEEEDEYYFEENEEEI